MLKNHIAPKKQIDSTQYAIKYEDALYSVLSYLGRMTFTLTNPSIPFKSAKMEIRIENALI